jgi:Mg-chelatase subunit ChlD
MILPALFILASMAINIAYMQLVSTQMKIASDTCAHAGGRAMSIEQTTDAAIAMAQEVAQLNLVGGRPLTLTTGDNDDDMEFGLSTRDGVGRFSFTPYSKAEVDAGTKRATSFAVTGVMDVPMVFLTLGGIDTVSQSRRSIATQVDRDIALVLDRSGSMLYYQDETALTAALKLLRDTEVQTEPVQKWAYYESYDSKKKKYSNFKGYYTHEDANNSWVFNPNDSIMDDSNSGQTMISQSEYTNATKFLYDRRYSQNVIEQLATVSMEMSQYAADWETMLSSSNSWWTRTPAPRYSRWSFLVEGVDAFLDVLDGTDQEELVTLVIFNNSATLALDLRTDYQSIRDYVADVVPYEGTAIGAGLLVGQPELMDGTSARPFAAKTIVVLTDGENNGAADPVTVTENMVAVDPITVHSVTFATDNSSAMQDMEDVATAGNGVHYHAETGPELVEIFREIANNLPTILTE